ncbi:MAG: hypothetical protein ABL973_08420 [Micropepsaceae bacterium]
MSRRQLLAKEALRVGTFVGRVVAVALAVTTGLRDCPVGPVHVAGGQLRLKYQGQRHNGDKHATNGVLPSLAAALLIRLPWLGQPRPSHIHFTMRI